MALSALIASLLAFLVLAGGIGTAPAADGPNKGATLAQVGLTSRGGAKPATAPDRLGREGRLATRSSVGEPGVRSAAPGAAESRYMATTAPRAVHAIGCSFGRRVGRHAELRDSLVVLDFGRPQRYRYRFGTSLFGHGFRSTDAVLGAAQAYVQGYWSCASPTAAAHLVLGIGTTNFGRQVTAGHGRAWGLMVNRAADWVARQPFRSHVTITGADDIELGWNGPRQTRRWVNGYASVARYPYFDYGDAAGCPPVGDCLGGWSVEDVWYVSWGVKLAVPLPEIYNPNGSSARQWQRMSLYGKLRHGRAMTIAGAMSQGVACRQSADPCWSMNNTPAAAWRLLSRALNSDRRTAQRLRWSTDVRWSR